MSEREESKKAKLSQKQVQLQQLKQEYEGYKHQLMELDLALEERNKMIEDL